MNDKDKSNDILKTGQNEVNQMKENLAKLYNLTEEEKSEESLLQARIEEQSHLIMMLKKRADEYLIRCQSLDRDNKDLESKLNLANDKNKTDDKKSRIVFQNFNKLSQTYEEMKLQFDSVRASNEKMQSDTANLKTEIALLKEKLENASDADIVRDDLQVMKLRNEQLETTIRDLNEKFSQKSLENGQEIKNKQLSIELLNGHLKEKETDLEELKKSSQMSIDKLKNENNMSLSEIKTLKTNLASQTSLIKKNNDEIAELAKKSKMYESLYKELKEKYNRESESINVNVQVQKLKADLQLEEIKSRELRQEFQAYKVYSNKLLQTEKELSSRLRKLYS